MKKKKRKNKISKADTSDYYTDVFSKGKKLEKIYDKNGKKIEIEGENIIEKFFNIIAIIYYKIILSKNRTYHQHRFLKIGIKNLVIFP